MGTLEMDIQAPSAHKTYDAFPDIESQEPLLSQEQVRDYRDRVFIQTKQWLSNRYNIYKLIELVVVLSFPFAWDRCKESLIFSSFLIWIEVNEL